MKEGKIMVKIGGVSIDVSHPKAFSEGMLKECMNMKYEYVCDDGGFRGEEEIDWLVKKFDLAGKVKKTKDMVDKVDIGFIQSCNWEKHIDQAMPFIEKGKPVFIDKPMVGSVKDANRVTLSWNYLKLLTIYCYLGGTDGKAFRHTTFHVFLFAHGQRERHRELSADGQSPQEYIGCAGQMTSICPSLPMHTCFMVLLSLLFFVHR